MSEAYNMEEHQCVYTCDNCGKQAVWKSKHPQKKEMTKGWLKISAAAEDNVHSPSTVVDVCPDCTPEIVKKGIEQKIGWTQT